MYIKIFADDKNTGDRRNAHEKLQTASAVQYHVTGNGKQKNAKSTSRSVLDQHTDKLNANDKVKCMLQKDVEGIGVGIVQKTRHFLQNRNDADEKADKNNDRHCNFHDLGDELQPVSQCAVLLLAAGNALHAFFLFLFGCLHSFSPVDKSRKQLSSFARTRCFLFIILEDSVPRRGKMMYNNSTVSAARTAAGMEVMFA